MSKKFTYEELEQQVQDNESKYKNLELKTKIEDQKRMEIRLRESEEKYRLIAENMANVITTMDMDLNFTYISPSIFKVRGYTVEEALGQRISDIMTPESVQRLSRVFAEELRLEESGTADPDRVRILELEEYKKDGSVIQVENTASFIRDKNLKPVSILVVSRDITQRKKMEATLTASESLFRGLYDNMTSGSAIYEVINDGSTGADYIVKNFNKKSLEMEKKTLDQVVGKSLYQLRPNIDDYGLIPLMKKVWETGKPADFPEKIYQDDQYLNYYENYIFKIPTGEVVTIYNDVTDQKNAEAAVGKSEEKYRLIAENMSDVVSIFDMNLRFTYASPSIKRLTGFSPEVFINQSIEEIMPPEYFEKSMIVFEEEIMLENSGNADPYRTRIMEIEQYTRDGSTVWVEVSCSFLRDTKKLPVGVLVISRDISDRKQAEREKERLMAQLHQAQKMEAIGNLAGGIAHEFNNILGIIIGNTELAIDDIPELNPAADCLQEIRTASFRAKDVVRKILSFAHKMPTERKPVKIDTIVRESLKLLRAVIPAFIEIRQSIVCESEVILADQTEVHQVIMNLCTNSFHAMKETPGVLEVIVEPADLDDAAAKYYEDLSPGRYVRLTVKDTGKGILPELMDRVLDPYFTTKEVDEGLGMGLAIVYGIVKKNDGAIKIESKIDKGTTVDVLFPIIESQGEITRSAPEEISKGSERILVVDDEVSLLKMVTLMLERLGYEVVGKASSTDALKLFQSDPERFDLVITDMAMPEMPGDLLAQAFMKIRPALPVILCTGHSDRIDEKRAGNIGFAGYYMKPFNKKDLAEAVRKALDKAKDSS